MDIHRSSVKDFVMPKIKSIVVIDYYEGLKGILTAREDFLYKDFFANPRMRTHSDILWSTESFVDRPSLLRDFHGTLKERYTYELKLRIEAVEKLIVTLKEEEGGEPLGELLSKAIAYIDEASVYCGNGQVVVVNWGLVPRHPDLGVGSIYRSGKFQGDWGKTFDSQGEASVAYKSSQTFSAGDSGVVQEIKEHNFVSSDDVPKVTAESGEVHNRIYPDHLDTVSQSQKTAEKLQAGSEEMVIHMVQERSMDTDHEEVGFAADTVEAEKQTSEDLTSTGEKGKVKKVISVSDENVSEKESMTTKAMKTGSSEVVKSEYTWHTFFEGTGKGISFFVRKTKWIWALFLLIILILFLCRDCQGPVSLVNPFYSPLPKHPVVMPINDENIGTSSDGMTTIATDRLNVLLQQQDDDTMLEWAKAFKCHYYGSDYEVMYYDKELDLIQLRVPASEREEIKEKLQEQINGFNFEVFDEVIQGEDVSLSDPLLTDPSYSWYFNPIQAKEAWDITLGNQEVVIAVVDNGFDMNHPEFADKIYRPYNVLSQNGNLRPIVTSQGVNAHGTHVAATAAGNCNNGSGLLGMAPYCKLMLVQVGNDNATGSLSSLAIMEGVMYAINQGADVINVSLGMNMPEGFQYLNEAQQLNYISNSYRQEELMWNKIYEKAKKNNCTIVFAAGNENVISGFDPKRRCKGIIKVSALDQGLGKADFSNYGIFPELDREYSTVSAPGVAIYSAAPNNQYMYMQGTSMAAPVVSGSIALLKSIDENLTTDQIIGLLKETGQNVGDNIGPMINIGNALQALQNDTVVVDKCEDIKQEIQRLKARIDSLLQICPGADGPADTLKYVDALEDKRGLDGVWKTTTNLVADSDNTPIELYMSFRNRKGVLTIINKGREFKAPLTADVKKRKIHITQHSPAQNGDDYFRTYEYKCYSDRNGNLLCIATSEENRVEFYLVRIK